MKIRTTAIGVWFISALLLSAQTFHVIYHFTGSSSPYAQGQLLLNGNILYGTTDGGGNAQEGTVFKINTNGTGYSVIKNFTALDTSVSTNTDGAQPMSGLVIWSNRLFGTTFVGGSGAKGTVFGVNTDGTNFVVLNNFNGTNGKNPYVGLTLSSNTLYGATAAGGISNKGAIFSINTDGNGFGLVKSFISSEGVLLLGGVTVGINTLYGTTYQGGISNRGTIYSVGTGGNGFTVLKTFSDGDGAQPRYNLALCGNTLYGITDGSGINSNSIVFRINTDGNSYSVIKRFSEPDPVYGTNYDGSYLRGGLVMWRGVLYGTTRWGGIYGNGVVFKVNPDGTGFAVLKQFSATTGTSNGNYLNADGMYPLGDLMVADGVLYGTTQYGGNYGCGTIYSVTIPLTSPLQTTNLAGQPVMFWSDDGLNRTLQTATDLASSSWTNVAALNFTNAASTPNQIGFQVTNLFNSPAAFFRLQ
jgi:uncharacterized repeat protein (TIGR03803 family)